MYDTRSRFVANFLFWALIPMGLGALIGYLAKSNIKDLYEVPYLSVALAAYALVLYIFLPFVRRSRIYTVFWLITPFAQAVSGYIYKGWLGLGIGVGLWVVLLIIVSLAVRKIRGVKPRTVRDDDDDVDPDPVVPVATEGRTGDVNDYAGFNVAITDRQGRRGQVNLGQLFDESQGKIEAARRTARAQELTELRQQLKEGLITREEYDAILAETYPKLNEVRQRLAAERQPDTPQQISDSSELPEGRLYSDL
jgi:hypothetical protein